MDIARISWMIPHVYEAVWPLGQCFLRNHHSVRKTKRLVLRGENGLKLEETEYTTSDQESIKGETANTQLAIFRLW